MTAPSRAGLGWVAVVLALVPALLPWLLGRQFLSDDALLYGYDSAQLQYPRFAILGSSLQEHGQLPLWQPLLNGGGPFHANPETPTLYAPVLILSAFLAPLLVINLTVLLHLSLAGLGMFLFVRRLGRRAGPGAGPGAGPSSGADETQVLVGALLAGVIFSSTHYLRMESWNLVMYGAAHALIPWILLATEALLHGQRPRRAAGALALLVAAQIFTGGLYVYAYTALLLLLWIVVEALRGGAAVRRRAFSWGSLALLVALLLAAAKLAGFAEWAAGSSRGGDLSSEVLEGLTLGGSDGGGGGFTLSLAWERLLLRTGGLPLLLLLPALWLLRRPGVAAASLALLLGLAVAFGGPAHAALSWLPPFDRIRNADRAWVLVSATLPILAGLGGAALIARLCRGQRLASLAAGLLLALGSLPLLLQSGEHTRILAEPASLTEVLRWRYPNWRDVAKLRRDERAMQVDLASPAARNEQFVAAAFGLEIVGGLLGHVWPLALERHAYGSEGAPLWDETRWRRLGVLSTRWLVTGHQRGLPDQVWDPFGSQAFPPGIDGTEVLDNPWARPRALEPSSVIAVLDDRDSAVTYALFDAPAFPMLAATVVGFPRGELPLPEELLALDEIVFVEEAAGAAVSAGTSANTSTSTLATAARITRVQWPLRPEDRQALQQVVARTVALCAERGAPRMLPVQRAHAESLSVTRLADPRRGPPSGGWVLLAETFALHGGWTAVGVAPQPEVVLDAVAGVRSSRVPDRPVTLRLADGVATAVYLPAERSALQLDYAPRSVRLGWWLGGLGLLLAAVLVTWPAPARPGS
ncbi:MAG: hypothetical protein ACT4PU_01075 [Planctomycetota bacterium]